MPTKEECMEVWRMADTVCFDVDSSLLKDEGLDELAEFCGAGAKVKELTRKAMGEVMSFRESLELRLGIIKPSLTDVNKFREIHAIEFSDGVQELVSCLQERGVTIYLVSGGFRSLIEPAAQLLNIPFTNIYANRLKFYFNGDYAGFDENQPTSASNGKKKVAELLKETSKNLVFIGDGMTDMEACPPADCFIGYGGNVVREQVKAKADWFIMDFQELISLLK